MQHPVDNSEQKRGIKQLERPDFALKRCCHRQVRHHVHGDMDQTDVLKRRQKHTIHCPFPHSFFFVSLSYKVYALFVVPCCKRCMSCRTERDETQNARTNGMYPVVRSSRRNTPTQTRNVALVTRGISRIHTSAFVRRLAFDVTLFPTPCIAHAHKKKQTTKSLNRKRRENKEENRFFESD